MRRPIRHLLFVLTACVGLHAADDLSSVPAHAAIEEEALPVFSLNSTRSSILGAQLRFIHRSLLLAGCKVEPLSEVSDPEALALENNVETSPVDVDGLTPDAAESLDALREFVTLMGGTFDLKSAYRPTAYQAHLREVWVKWMKQLRGNRSAGCRFMREEVGAEFARHRLLVRQQPVPDSDHSLGLAFDAAIAMPRAARLNGKRVTVDKLAALAGFKRPNVRRDPVHFKLLAVRPVGMSSASGATF